MFWEPQWMLGSSINLLMLRNVLQSQGDFGLLWGDRSICLQSSGHNKDGFSGMNQPARIRKGSGCCVHNYCGPWFDPRTNQKRGEKETRGLQSETNRKAHWGNSWASQARPLQFFLQFRHPASPLLFLLSLLFPVSLSLLSLNIKLPSHSVSKAGFPPENSPLPRCPNI